MNDKKMIEINTDVHPIKIVYPDRTEYHYLDGRVVTEELPPVFVEFMERLDDADD